MRIGIDATPLPARPVGAGAYIIHLVRALAALHSHQRSDYELVVFAHQSRIELFGLPPDSPVEWAVVTDRSPALRLAWEQSALPVLARRSGIDLLHSLHYTRPLRLPCASVVTFHDMTFFLFPELHVRSKRLFFPAMMRLSARLADALIADSESTRQDAMRILGIPPEKIQTVPLGIDSVFRPITDPERLAGCRERYHLPEYFILFVGLVEPRKNLPLLLQACAQLELEGGCPPLVVVGRLGWMYTSVFEQVKALNLQEKVHFTGYVPTEDLALIYNQAQIFIYPSRYEGFGFPPLEAMACGTPVITSAVSSMREFVGEAGLLISPQDVEALAQAMQTLLKDQDLRVRLSLLGRQQAARYTWNNTAQQTLEIYQQVLAR